MPQVNICSGGLVGVLAGHLLPMFMCFQAHYMNVVKDSQWCFKCECPPHELNRLTKAYEMRSSDKTRRIIREACVMKQVPGSHLVGGLVGT